MCLNWREFVDAMLRLNTDDSLWNMLFDGGLASLHGQFTPAVAEGALRAALSDICATGTHNSRRSRFSTFRGHIVKL